MNNFKKYFGLTIFFLLLFFLVIGFIKRGEFEKEHKIAVGFVKEISRPGSKSSGDYSILYEFYIDNRAVVNNSNYFLCNDLTYATVREILVNKSFPVAYSDGLLFRQNSLIITLKDAERFNYNFPDSLLIYDSLLSCKK